VDLGAALMAGAVPADRTHYWYQISSTESRIPAAAIGAIISTLISLDARYHPNEDPDT